ncbi:MAG: adenylate kinase [Gammaproteobacteria bacterium]|nr:adenylate kinase [Gammaproteobacteria bacterium]RZO96808.1 MAG: adenylate kinase [Gammaproteobacteria bacterium]
MKVILLGPPGAGKGTQAEVLCKHFKIPHISTGNILREAIESGSRFGAEAKKLMDRGILVSDEVIVGIVVDRIKEEDCKLGFLFDGYPRTIPQAEALDSNDVNIDLVIELDVPDDVIINRMSGRRVHLPSGRNYHIDFNKPKIDGKDDISGEPLVQREDDKKETVKDRLEVFRSQTLPLIDFYQDRAKNKELRYLKILGLDAPKKVSELLLEKISDTNTEYTGN